MTLDAIERFRTSIQAAGLNPPDDIVADGKLHRFTSNGKRGDNSGWYVLHLDGLPAGRFGDWRSGVDQGWRADIGRTLTPAEEAQHRVKLESMRREREAEEARGNEAAAKQAETIASEDKDATEEHGYLKRKGIKPHGTKLLADGRLAIPMRDANGKLWNIERIAAEKPADGSTDKKGLYRGKRIGCYFSIGDPKGAAALAICEGFATGASVHEATGLPVVVAFNAGNLGPVAKAMRAKYPDVALILCADDDAATDGNPGVTKAGEAARSVGALLAIPDFGNNRQAGQTDFNDLHRAHGLEAVQRIIDDAMASVIEEVTVLTESEVSKVSEVQASNGGLSADTPSEAAKVSEVSDPATSPIPDITERPAFRVFDDWLEHGGVKFKPGVWHFGTDKDDNPIQTWVCSPLHVEAVTYDGQDNHFGRLLRFKNTLRRWREWAMPMEMLRGAGDDLRGELLAMGVEIDPTSKARSLLASYLQAKPPKRRMRCALQIGWCDDSYVLPDAVIGPRASGVIFQSGERAHDEHTRAGTLEDWRTEISLRAVGNPLLLLALSASFAGPMLARCNAEGGGIHYIGDSSTGKTTAIEAACATWGGPNFRRSWRATANGMEGAAALFNDCLLALDEISECDPREVGAIVYALGNGRGKQRAGRTGNARAVVRWRCIVLSSGERTIATTMAEGGQRAKAGQAVRLLDIPSARAFGAWDTLHGLPSGTAFSDAIKRAAATHYGHAGRAFLEKLTRDERDFCALLERIKGLPTLSADGGEGQDKRAAARFALLALAGELASEYGITGWPEGEAIKAASVCFKSWHAMRGRGNDERRQILDRVSGFIERHGDGRFSDADGQGESQLRDRAGWWRGTAEGREYLFTADGMREALKGFDFGRALDALQEAGALPVPGADGKRAKFYRIGGRGVKLYPVQADKLGSDHGA